MDPRLLEHYDRELRHVREVGAEFAAEYPKIAARLGMDGLEVADPYVERLLEGFAFLAARVQLKLTDQYAVFTQHLLEMVYPHYLCPTPSMAVVQFEPDSDGAELRGGYRVARGTALRGVAGDSGTACEYRTGADLDLWPLRLAGARYGRVAGGGAKASLRLRFEAEGGADLRGLGLDRLRVFIRAPDGLRARLYEQLAGHAKLVRVVAQGNGCVHRVAGARVTPVGFDDDEALLPHGPRSFSGYRLLKEYFELPERFAFVELEGLREALSHCDGKVLELDIGFDVFDARLDQTVDATHFALHCVPTINLFTRHAERIHLNARDHEYHVVVDRARPMDFEVFDVQAVDGIGTNARAVRRFLPLYSHKPELRDFERDAFFSLRRVPRRPSSRERRLGARSSYVGSETYVSIVDARDAPYSPDLRQLGLALRCTNRDLPLHMPIGRGDTDFVVIDGAPVRAVRCVAGPTRPRSPVYGGDTPWRLISHLSLNYLTLGGSDGAPGSAAGPLRELLALYAHSDDASQARRVESLVDVTTKRVTRRLPGPGPIAFGRGVEVALTVDESRFEGAGLFLFGAVMERFLARYASINAFTQTVVHSTDRGEVSRWPIRSGARALF